MTSMATTSRENKVATPSAPPAICQASRASSTAETTAAVQAIASVGWMPSTSSNSGPYTKPKNAPVTTTSSRNNG